MVSHYIDQIQFQPNAMCVPSIVFYKAPYRGRVRIVLDHCNIYVRRRRETLTSNESLMYEPKSSRQDDELITSFLVRRQYVPLPREEDKERAIRYSNSKIHYYNGIVVYA